MKREDLHGRILEVLQKNDFLSMDSEKDRLRLAEALSEALADPNHGFCEHSWELQRQYSDMKKEGGARRYRCQQCSQWGWRQIPRKPSPIPDVRPYVGKDGPVLVPSKEWEQNEQRVVFDFSSQKQPWDEKPQDDTKRPQRAPYRWQTRRDGSGK